MKKYAKVLEEFGLVVDDEELAKKMYCDIFTSAEMISQITQDTNLSEYAQSNTDVPFGIVAYPNGRYSIIKIIGDGRYSILCSCENLLKLATEMEKLWKTKE